MPRRIETIYRSSNRFFGRLARADAFVHALRMALATKSKLYLVHVGETNYPVVGFPHIRYALARWGLMNENDPPSAVGKLGIKVAKVDLRPQDPLGGLLGFLERHPSDLIVLATHGRDGVAHWLHGSIAEKLLRAAQLSTLFMPPTARGFVDQINGKVHLSRVLVPIDHSPPPSADAIREFIRPMNEQGAAIEFMHVSRST